MSAFLHDDFLLPSPAARTLYQSVREMPVADYCCRLNLDDLCADRRYDDLTQLWLDHGKQRLMRGCGAAERFITGDADGWEKFRTLAEVLPRAAGNPMYHLCHLELKTCFGYDGVLDGQTAREVWQLTQDRLRRPDMSARSLLAKSGAVFLAQTADPTDELARFKALADAPDVQAEIVPVFSPDRVFAIGREGWTDDLFALGRSAGVQITGLETLKLALSRRMEHFAVHGCRSGALALERMVYRPMPQKAVDVIMQKGMGGQYVTSVEAEGFQTAVLLFCAWRYQQLGWAMELSFNRLRSVNTAMGRTLGKNAGFDAIAPGDGCTALAGLLDALYARRCLTRTVITSPDPGDGASLDALLGCFQGNEQPGLLQRGLAPIDGFPADLTGELSALAHRSVLGTFIGAPSGAGCLTSLTAWHDYFRRVLCRLLSGWAEEGLYPVQSAEALVRDVCFHNAAHFFRLDGTV